MTRWIVPALFGLILGSLAHAELSIDFDLVREGSRPSLTGEQFASAKQLIINELAQFRGHFMNAALPAIQTDSQCRRYAIADERVLLQLRTSLQNLSGNAALDQLDDDQFQVRLRFELLNFANLALYKLFHQNSERDFSALDSGVHAGCAFANRQALSKAYDQLITDMNDLRARGFGMAGLKTLDRATDRWIKIAQATAARRDFHSKIVGAFNVATIAATIFLPGVMARVPFAIEGLLRQFAFTEGAIRAGSLVHKIDVGLLAADLGGNYVLTKRLQPDEDRRHANYGLSWQDTIHQVEVLLDAPLSYAQLGIAYLGEVKYETAVLFSAYLHQNSGELKRMHGKLFDETMALDLEGVVIGNHPIRDQLVRLEHIVNDHYGYQVSCRDGSYKNFYLGSVNDLNCFAALRRFTRLAYATDLPELSLAGNGAVTFEFNYQPTSFDANTEPLRASLNVDAGLDEIRQFVQNVVYSPALKQRLVDNQRFANLANTLTLNTGVPISADVKLSPAARWRGLNTLAIVVQSSPRLLDLSAEEIHLQERFEPLADHGQKLRLGLAAEASLEQMQAFLREQAVNPQRTARLVAFQVQLEQMVSVITQIKSRGFDANCSYAGELSLAACIKTLLVVDQILAQSSPKYLRASEIASVYIVGLNESDESTTVRRLNDSEQLVVRESTLPIDLALYLRHHGWIHADTNSVCDNDGDTEPCASGG